ncbi:glycoside hydrolase family 3 C-terminal domain-containing protein [Luteimicrobium xylanilyticum]|uniref:Beta-glucosidase n=1 Tax=Luteimicrobium xylanilyticum TaxID=1133546 RepID=A0A5P9QEQ5_9MICO|nr:glycoside hydrolase family 3 C-terminal domain-containing protein [Luteimicrobium xylanilyticum]QFU98935.1 Beta-glucosidase [Luteimicrobium xylanilyticum]
MTDTPVDLARRAALTSGSDTWHTTALAGPGGGDEERQIPRLTLSDGPHGLRRQPEGGDALGIGGSVPATCFPPACTLGASWDPSLVERVGAALGEEARAMGVHVVLGPGLNIKRSPLGGRNFEYVSEDPHLTGRFGAALVRGLQSRGVAATPKHFAVNNQETDRWRASADVDERTLRELYLPAFEHVVREARPWALMTAYNKVNGTYASEHAWLLQTVLREEWGFDGVVMSDWGAVADRVASLQAGLDLEMPPSGTDAEVAAAVQDGRLDAQVLDQVADRLARLAERTGPHPAPATTSAVAPGLDDATVDAHHALAREAARDSVVLLRNDGTLPVDPDRTRTVAVVGELARTPRFQGGGSSRVVPTRTDTPLGALCTALDDVGVGTTFDPGYVLGPEMGAAAAVEEDELRAEAVAAARSADVTILFLGLPDASESEGFDRTTLALPAGQLALLEAVGQTATPLVVVLAHGGVVDLRAVNEHAGAILDAGLAGQAGGAAVADVLLGAEPGGRLTETVPHALQDTPSYLGFPGRDGHVAYGEGVFVGYRGYDTVGRDVSYPFGHGLSYTTFAYTDLELHDVGELAWGVEFTVTNTGRRAGSDVAQLYVGRDTGPGTTSPDRPVHELRGFRKVRLAPGESERVRLLVAARDLATWDVQEHRWRVDPGEYRVEVAASCRDVRLVGTLSTPGDGHRVRLTAMSTLGEWARRPVGARLMERLRAAVPADAAREAPELVAMVSQVPLVKLTGWGFGLTREAVDAMVAQAAQEPGRAGEPLDALGSGRSKEPA